MAHEAKNQFYKITSKSKLESQLIELLTRKVGIKITDTNKPISCATNTMMESLIDAINQAFHIKLNNNVIQQKTISEIADLMILETRAKSRNMVMPLNGIKGKPSLYFICGITLYSPLAKNLSKDFSCYGIYVPQEKYFFEYDADKKDSLTIPNLASYYVEAIIKHASENASPENKKSAVAVAGVSFGGILAFEVARQLKQEGHEISGLVILDAILPGALTRPWSLTRKLVIKKIKSYLSFIFKRRNVPLSKATAKVSAREKKKTELSKIIQGKAVQAYFNSLPTFNGSSLIVRAANQYGHIVEPSLCWSSKLKGPIFLAESPGTHLEIIQSNETAKLISTYIHPTT